MLAASLSAFGARSPRTVDPAALVPDPEPDAPARVAGRPRPAARLPRRRPAGLGRRRRGLPIARFALTDADPVDDHVLQPNLGIAAMLIDDDERGLRLHERAADRGPPRGRAEHGRARPHPRRPLPDRDRRLGEGRGRGRGGAAAGREHRAPGHDGAAHRGTRRRRRAARRATPPTTTSARSRTIREAHPVGITDASSVDLAHWARGLRATGQPAAALHHLEQISGPRRAPDGGAGPFRRPPSAPAAPTSPAPGWPSSRSSPPAPVRRPRLAVVEHGRALLAEDGDAEEHFRRALAAHADSLRLPDRARTELAYGEYLRRARRRVDAREHLRTALALFEELGAAPVGRASRAGAARLRGDRPAAGRDHSDGPDRAGTAGRRPGPAGPVEPGRRRTAVRQRPAPSTSTCATCSPSSASPPAPSSPPCRSTSDRRPPDAGADGGTWGPNLAIFPA